MLTDNRKVMVQPDMSPKPARWRTSAARQKTASSQTSSQRREDPQRLQSDTDTIGIESPPNAAGGDNKSPVDGADPEHRFHEVLQPTTDVLYLDPDGVMRPIDHRWQLALRRVNNEAVPSEWILATTRQAIDFIRDLKRCRKLEDFLALKLREPHKFAAVELRVRKPAYWRWEIEGLILACEPFERIAARFGMPVEVIRWYEPWFFHVTDRLDNASYIFYEAIRLHSSPEDEEVGAALRLYGYIAGPHVVETLLHGLNPESRPQAASEVVAFLRQDVSDNLLIKAAIAARLMKVTPENHIKIINLYLRMKKIEATTEQKIRIPETYSANAAAMVDWFRWDRPVSPKDPESLVGKMPPVAP